MPVANKPRYLVMGKRCVTLVLSKSLSCIEHTKVSILDTNTHKQNKDQRTIYFLYSPEPSSK